MNLGILDRLVRFVLGWTILTLMFAGPHFDPEGAWGFGGIVLFMTAFAGWCPLYALFRLSTLRPRPALEMETPES
jgi:hypothetical protein